MKKDFLNGVYNFISNYRNTALICVTIILAFNIKAFTLPVPQNIVSDNEPNNSPLQASSLSPNSTILCSIGEGSDYEDWYKITLPSEGELKVWAEVENDMDVSIDFFDKSGIWWIGDRYFVGGIGVTDSTKRSNLMAGEYFIKVWRESGSGNYTLKNKYTPTSIPNGNDIEPNNESAQAISFQPNIPLTGHIGYVTNERVTDNVDWYKITLPNDGELKVWADIDKSLDIAIDFYDKSGIWWIGDRFYVGGLGAPDSTKRSDLMAGEYFIKVWRESGQGSYTLKNKFTPASIPNGNDNEPNNESVQALNLQPNTSLTGHIGYMSNDRASDNVDWYKVTLPNDGELKVWADIDKSLDIAIEFFDKSSIWWIGNRFFVGGTGVTDSTKRSDLMAGEYYIKLWRESGHGSYTLKNKFIPASIPDGNDQEPNNEATLATSMQMDITRTGHIGYVSDERAQDYYDWFVFNVPENMDLEIITKPDNTLDINEELYNQQMNFISSCFHCGGMGETDSLKKENLQSGTYYLKISTSSGYGSYEIIAKKHIKTNVSNSHLSKADFYPNPCNGKLNIKTKAEDIDELKIYDSTGRLFARLEKIKANSFIEILIPYKGLFYCISSVKGKTEVIKIMVL